MVISSLSSQDLSRAIKPPKASAMANLSFLFARNSTHYSIAYLAFHALPGKGYTRLSGYFLLYRTDSQSPFERK